MTLPHVPDSFYWTTAPWGAALRCRALEPFATHLFTTRQLSLSSPADYEQLAQAVGVDRVLALTQVHGSSVTVVRRGANRDSDVRRVRHKRVRFRARFAPRTVSRC